jgi:hypothetical protein
MPGLFYVPIFSKKSLSEEDSLLLQVQTRLAFTAALYPKSWIATMMLKPSLFQTKVLPSSVIELQMTEHLRWYACKKGHPYAVGNCGMPMQTARCHCGAPIGGKDHQSIDSVKSIEMPDMNDLSAHGYTLSKADVVKRMRPGMKWFFRLIIHLCLLSCWQMRADRDLRTFLFGKKGLKKTRKEVGQNLVEQTRIAWRNFRDAKANDTTCVILQNVLLEFLSQQETCLPNIDVFSSGRTTQNFEKSIQGVYDEMYSRTLTTLGDSAANDLRLVMLESALGPKMWEMYQETSPKNADHRILLWRYVERIRLDEFFREADVLKDRFRYPLLNAFLENEERLGMIRHISSVLQWHKVMFDLLGNSEITREEARVITNQDLLNRIFDQSERERAERVLKEYCFSFNTSFPLVENIYECQRNPFIKDGKVDIGGPMSPSTPVIFSLPSMMHGENDAAGLCTVQLLLHLHRLHEELFRMDNVNPRNEDEEDRGREPEGAGEEDLSYGISYLTPVDVLRSKLVVYDRHKDLIPLLHAYAEQSLTHGSDSSISYDFKQIESGIRTKLLSGKQSVKIQIRQYQYRGDVRRNGRVSGLRRRIPQENLPLLVLNNICDEFDTQERVLKFLSRLEVCMSFLAEVGGEQVRGIGGIAHMPLRKYAIENLQMEEDEWSDVSTDSVNTHVQLCHLQSLYLKLEETMQKSPIEEVMEKYREPLSPKQEEALEKVLGPKLNVVFSVLRDFMTDQLTEDKWDGNASLKDYLMYTNGMEEAEEEWFDIHFPDAFELRHAYHTFQWMAKNLN